MSPEGIPVQKSVEEQANAQENASEILFDRLSNPIIRKQIIDLIEQSEIWRKENKVFYNEAIKLPDGTWKKDANGEMVFDKIPYTVRSREEIEAEYDKTLDRIKRLTDISFNSREPFGGSSEDVETINLNWKLPAGDKPSSKQLSVIEAHEKGHSIRSYDNDFFREYFSGAFDKKLVEYTDEQHEYTVAKHKEHGEDGNEPIDYNELKEGFHNYILSGTEIAERMSQLKNYFGFRRDEQFTLEHLKYAKEHYVQDVGFDNMSVLLNAVTPETEGEFIRLINCSGI
jgi:hypothetical protein